MFEEAIDDEDQRHHDRHELDHQPGEPLYAAVEGGLDLLAGEAAGHLAEVGLRAGGDNHRRGRAALDAGAEEAGVRAFDGRDVAAQVAASVFSTGMDSPVRVAWMTNRSLADRSRTSPGTMSPAESLTMSPGTSCWSGISLGLAVAHDGGGDANHRFEFGGGSVRLGFLDETQRYTQNHHQQHDRRRRGHPRWQRQNRQDGQQDHQRVAGGNIEAVRPAFMFLAADFVGAVLLQARGGFLLRQACGGSAEQAQHLGAVLGRRVAGEIGLASIVWTGQSRHTRFNGVQTKIVLLVLLVHHKDARPVMPQ